MNLKIPAPKGFRLQCCVENKLYSFQGLELWELDFETRECIKIPLLYLPRYGVLSHPSKVVYSRFNHRLYIFNSEVILQFSLFSRTIISFMHTSSLICFLYETTQPDVKVLINEQNLKVVSELLLPELATIIGEYLAQISIESFIIKEEEVVPIFDKNYQEGSLLIARRGSITVNEEFNCISIISPKKTTLLRFTMNVYVDNSRVWYQNVDDGSITYSDL